MLADAHVRERRQFPDRWRYSSGQLKPYKRSMVEDMVHYDTITNNKHTDNRTHNRVTLPPLQLTGVVQADEGLNRGQAVALHPAQRGKQGRMQITLEFMWRGTKHTDAIVDVHECIILDHFQHLRRHHP